MDKPDSARNPARGNHDDARRHARGGSGAVNFERMVGPGRVRPTGIMLSLRWRRVLRSAGLDARAVASLLRAACANGTSLQEELLSRYGHREFRLCEALSEETGLPFRTAIDPENLEIDERDLHKALCAERLPRMAFHRAAEAVKQVLITPAVFDFTTMQSFLDRYPSIADRMAIVTAASLRQAMLAKARPWLVKQAVRNLPEQSPHLSSHIVANGFQGLVLGLFAAALLILVAHFPIVSLTVAHCLFSAGFLSCGGIRLWAAIRLEPGPCKFRPDPNPKELPVYSILVPLYGEADMVPDLLIALARLRWPRSKLDIKLLLEEDDTETRRAVEDNRSICPFEVLVIPKHAPTTKPKALNYALPTVRGEFVVVYDAEDIPHPKQLQEAWLAFQDGDDRLACIQSPLDITNGPHNLLTAHFAFEYSALFRGLLPVLAKTGVFFPLGGTSNHFRASVLRRVLGWDPRNVTEDADLAVRLVRYGYRLGMIDAPTLEEAPSKPGVWLRQRTRWFKGWMQTVLVHSRNPVATAADMKAASFSVFAIILLGIILSSLTYILIPIILLSIIYSFWILDSLSTFHSILFFADLTVISLGLFSYLLLGWRSLNPRNRHGYLIVALTTLFYWFALSIAAWRALPQLFRTPFHWEKTPHQRRNSGSAKI